MNNNDWDDEETVPCIMVLVVLAIQYLHLDIISLASYETTDLECNQEL